MTYYIQEGLDQMNEKQEAEKVAEINILKEIDQERKRQDTKWGGSEHDDNHHTVDFCRFIKNYTGWAEQMAMMESPDKARNRLIQIAALAVAAVESIDRKFQGANNEPEL